MKTDFHADGCVVLSCTLLPSCGDEEVLLVPQLVEHLGCLGGAGRGQPPAAAPKQVAELCQGLTGSG